MTFDATAAARVIAAASGRNSRPATNAEAPVIACRYSEDRKIAPTTTPVIPAITAEAEISDRIRQVVGGTSGEGLRRSRRGEAASSAAAITRAIQVRGAVQPAERVASMPYTSARRPPTRVRAPGASRRRSAPRWEVPGATPRSE